MITQSCSISDTGYRECVNEFADFACISRTDDRMYEIHKISISYINRRITIYRCKWHKVVKIKCCTLYCCNTECACEQPTRVFHPRCYLNQVINRAMWFAKSSYTTTSVLHWLCLHVCCPRVGFFFAMKMNLATWKERIDSALHTTII